MGFRINTNVASLRAQANSAATNRSLDKSLERLSSGLRINSAADDASGLAIADSLRNQADSLGQAINNTNDGLAIMQTADKAMDEQGKILDSIKVKATQAAQDGQTTKSRQKIQADINRLMEELDNIANTTSFNGKQLLGGSFVNQEFQVGASSNETIKATIGSTNSSKIGLTRFETGQSVHDSGTASLVIKNYNGKDDFTFKSVVISTSVGTGLGTLAEEINQSTDKTGVRASFLVRTVGAGPIQEGHTFDNFAINGVKIGKIDYKANDETGSLVSAINSVKDSTGVVASLDSKGALVLDSRDGRGIQVEGIGGASGVFGSNLENYGRLSLVKNNGSDIDIGVSTGTTNVGFSIGAHVSQESVSLRESKGEITVDQADAMGFNAYAGGAKQLVSQNVSTGAGFSAGSGMSLAFASFSAGTISATSALYASATGKLNASNAQGATAGVTTLKGAMAVMDIADSAISNLDDIRADIGSVQNQMSATLNNITVTKVNVQAAESNIRDVDFASESAIFSKDNILAQSGSYALTQANAAQQQVLRLLQ